MAYDAKLLADSISPNGIRLVSMEATYPRFIHSEVLTHRVYSRNSSSSRAIPIEKMIKQVVDDPVIPVRWGKNQKGMQAFEELSKESKKAAEIIWLKARDEAVNKAYSLLNCGVHKQLVNRILEPWMWITIIITGTEWDNFINLRTDKDAQPEIQTLVATLRSLYYGYTKPQPPKYGGWHLPFITDEDERASLFQNPNSNEIVSDKEAVDWLKRVSAGRCARVSYLTHDGKRDHQADIELCKLLLSGGHYSPLEHQARPMTEDDLFSGLAMLPFESPPYAGNMPSIKKAFCGNFRGWISFRKEIPNEAVWFPG